MVREIFQETVKNVCGYCPSTLALVIETPFPPEALVLGSFEDKKRQGEEPVGISVLPKHHTKWAKEKNKWVCTAVYIKARDWRRLLFFAENVVDYQYQLGSYTSW